MKPPHHQRCTAYCNSVMEPWDGPAALAPPTAAGCVAGMDRNGLRPLRVAYTDHGRWH